MNIFLIVITTFEENFLKINELRRQQCKQYKIPVLFVYNGEVPEGFVFQKDEIQLQMKTDHLPYPINPIMFLKFIYAVKELYKEYGYEPDYFVRCTATCFIDFKKLPIVLRTLPPTKCIAGIFDSKFDDRLFCNGTCMIVSNDVAKQLAEEDVFGNRMCIIENDDVVISWLGSQYGFLLDLTYWFAYYEGLEELPGELKTVPSKTVFYRIKNVKDRKTIDVGIWNMLFTQIDKNI